MRASQSPNRAPRGAALIVAVLLMIILGVVGVAALQRASDDQEAVGAKRHHDKLISCADAARELLMSQFSTYGAPAELTLNTPVGSHVMATGHYDQLAVKSVIPTTSASGGGSSGVADDANRSRSSRLGGQVYRMTVVCSANPDAGALARQSEVEFLVRFGL
jgi:multisubunit Na+/H+ antiporter MnhG subunit